MARKQVERSHLDPQVFLVTYTAEHSDHHPPRSSRNKTRLSNNLVVTPEAATQLTTTTSSPLEDSIIEDEPIVSVSNQCLNKDQDAKIGEIIVTGHNNILTNDDWFPSVDELSYEFSLDGYLQGQF